MNWEDECYLLSKRKFRENANIINVFTLNKGKVGGIVYGGCSQERDTFCNLFYWFLAKRLYPRVRLDPEIILGVWCSSDLAL